MELMVVLVIFAIVGTFALSALNLPGASDPLAREGRRLRTLLTLASDQAVLSDSVLGLRFLENGYDFVRRDDQGHWDPFQSPPALVPRILADEIGLNLLLEERWITLDDIGDREPHLIFYPTGEISPFLLEMRGKEGRLIQLSGDEMGRLEMIR